MKEAATEAASKLALLWHTLDDERTRLRCFASYCVNLFHVRRIVKGLCFLNAIERIGDETLRRSAIEGGYFVGAGDVVTA
jgi:hypothetical protein